MDIQHVSDDKKGTFFIEEDGQRVAEMVYSKAGETLLIIEHTEVNETLKGKGAGKQLVFQGVAYARAMGLRIMPLCPFAKLIFEKYPELRDVL